MMTMRKEWLGLLSLIISFVMILFFCSCASDEMVTTLSETQRMIEAPDFIEIPNIDDTYQLEPRFAGINEPEVWYISGAPDLLSMDENGLITALANIITSVYINAMDGETGEVFVKEVMVAAGEVKAYANSSIA